MRRLVAITIAGALAGSCRGDTLDDVQKVEISWLSGWTDAGTYDPYATVSVDVTLVTDAKKNLVMPGLTGELNGAAAGLVSESSDWSSAAPFVSFDELPGGPDATIVLRDGGGNRKTIVVRNLLARRGYLRQDGQRPDSVPYRTGDTVTLVWEPDTDVLGEASVGTLHQLAPEGSTLTFTVPASDTGAGQLSQDFAALVPVCPFPSCEASSWWAMPLMIQP